MITERELLKLITLNSALKYKHHSQEEFQTPQL
jgi:hypothetical protein